MMMLQIDRVPCVMLTRFKYYNLIYHINSTTRLPVNYVVKNVIAVSYTHLDVYKRQGFDGQKSEWHTDYEPAVNKPKNWSIIW